ncbi:hypothetical protein L6452_17816 [Arctium lappa]|uniref:Uncharacterized protein n=1 Tax=Arctium lappa TaxID=4217 RepID=A0ACB9C4M9_ARCLA|nr:hypothetical protein L6452_17816 [Arctium lappa]
MRPPVVEITKAEYGDKNLGTTKAIALLLVSGSDVGDGKIEFDESFRLHVKLLRDMPIRGGDNDIFLKNSIEFNMYESRRNKILKGHLLATAVVGFVEYGLVKDGLIISVPMNCKMTFSNTAQPMLFLEIQTVEKNNRVKVKVFKVDENIGSLKVMESQVNDVDDQQSCMPLSNKDESQNGQENQIMGDLESNILSADRFKKLKPFRSPLDFGNGNASWRRSKFREKIKNGFHTPNGEKSLTSNQTC